ncbi:hypothetical protein IL306_009287, partial [Fusarium sp. DS 682]
AKETAQKTPEKISSFFAPYLSAPQAQVPDQGKSAREVFSEINKKKLETYLQTLPAPYQQARLENATYLGCNHEDTCKGASRRWIARYNAINKAFVRALNSWADLEVEIEPLVQQESSLRADFAVTIGNSRYFYDIQIVAISKDSVREDAYSTLKEAADEKRRKYKCLGAFFHPLILSAGGLMDQETSQTYKKLQELIGPLGASQLDSAIGLALTKTRAISATSIARDLPRKTHS